MASTVEEICPSVEDITRKETTDPLPCPTQGCSRVFHNRPCLRMHLIKTHGIASNSEEKQLYVRGHTKNQVEKHFYCPVKHCVRGRGTKRPFPRMSQLKQVTHFTDTPGAIKNHLRILNIKILQISNGTFHFLSGDVRMVEVTGHSGHWSLYPLSPRPKSKSQCPINKIPETIDY